MENLTNEELLKGLAYVKDKFNENGYYYKLLSEIERRLISIPMELPVKPEIADKEDLLIYLKYIGERLRLKDDVFINSFTKYGIVNHIITKIENSKI